MSKTVSLHTQVAPTLQRRGPLGESTYFVAATMKREQRKRGNSGQFHVPAQQQFQGVILLRQDAVGVKAVHGRVALTSRHTQQQKR